MEWPFRHRMRVRWSECDQQGVVFYANYLAYYDIAMTELFRAALGAYESVLQAGVDMVVGEARIAYRGSARFDDEIDLVVRPPSFGTTSMTTALGVERADGAVLTEGELRHVFVDLQTFQKRPVPEDVREALAA